MKPGVKTSELYVTMIVVALNAVLASGMLDGMPDVVRVVSAILTVAAALGYVASRTIAKGGQTDGNIE